MLDLDIRAIRCLEYLNCERNGMKSLQVNGASLKNLFASHNSRCLLLLLLVEFLKHGVFQFLYTVYISIVVLIATLSLNKHKNVEILDTINIRCIREK